MLHAFLCTKQEVTVGARTSASGLPDTSGQFTRAFDMSGGLIISTFLVIIALLLDELVVVQYKPTWLLLSASTAIRYYCSTCSAFSYLYMSINFDPLVFSTSRN